MAVQRMISFPPELWEKSCQSEPETVVSPMHSGYIQMLRYKLSPDPTLLLK